MKENDAEMVDEFGRYTIPSRQTRVSSGQGFNVQGK